MQLEHIALTVNNKSEINSFYKQILGLEEVKNFVLEESLSAQIFGIQAEIPVFQLKNDQLFLEIFVNPMKQNQGFNHLCFKMKERESFLKKVVENDYECNRIKRAGSDLIFIKDKSKNIFEIKE